MNYRRFSAYYLFFIRFDSIATEVQRSTIRTARQQSRSTVQLSLKCITLLQWCHPSGTYTQRGVDACTRGRRWRTDDWCVRGKSRKGSHACASIRLATRWEWAEIVISIDVNSFASRQIARSLTHVHIYAARTADSRHISRKTCPRAVVGRLFDSHLPLTLR